MKILIVTNSYPPEIRSTSHLMYELATEFYARGHNVTVLTSFPRYNLAKPKIRDQMQDKMTENGITVLRVKTLPLKKVGYLLRGLAELTLPFKFWNLLKKHASDFNVVWVFSPPLSLAILGAWVKKHLRCKMLLNVQDIFPQNGIDLRIIKNRAVIFFYETMEKLSYHHSDMIIVHSEGNCEFLVKEKHVSRSKIFIQYNWIDIKLFDQARRTGMFRKKYGIKNEIVAIFAGVIGPAQGLEWIIEAACHFKNDYGLVFLLVGDGLDKERLQSEAKKRNITNIFFHPFVSKEEYPYLVKDADIGLASLSEKMKTPVIPGKIQSYMAAGLPILGILNKESDGHILLREAKAGISIQAGHVYGAVKAIKKLRTSHDLRKTMGESGHRYANLMMSKKACVDKICSLMGRL